MADKKRSSLTDGEAEFMNALWKIGQGTAEEIRKAVAGDPHDSTVRTMLRILEAKGFVRHERRGKAFVYQPAIAKEAAQGSALKKLLRRMFQGSAKELAIRLLQDEVLTPEMLDDALREIQSSRYDCKSTSSAKPNPPDRNSQKGKKQ